MEDYRLDVYLQINNLTESREKAKQLIQNSFVYVNDKLITKCSVKVNLNDNIVIKETLQYVSRGASKIEKAIKYFNIDIDNKTAIDIGASTGGFTDFLIKNNAKKVYAIDVGHAQLHESLKKNDQVINLEKTNFRYIDASIFNEDIDIIVVDVSFISLKLIFPKIAEISNDDTDIIVLIKPQFEAGRQNIGKNGIVKDKKIHLEVLNNIITYCDENKLYLKDLTFSPIQGGDGNIEYLGYIKKGLNKSLLKIEYKFKDLILEAFE